MQVHQNHEQVEQLGDAAVTGTAGSQGVLRHCKPFMHTHWQLPVLVHITPEGGWNEEGRRRQGSPVPSSQSLQYRRYLFDCKGRVTQELCNLIPAWGPPLFFISSPHYLHAQRGLL
jgi:hypothetical protein